MWLPTHAEDHFVLRPEVLEAHCAKDPGLFNRLGCRCEASIAHTLACCPLAQTPLEFSS
jgi:hypothetical protein